MKKIRIIECEKCNYPNSEFSNKCLECAKSLHNSKQKVVKVE